MTPVLVVGATSPLGSAICHHLAARGMRILMVASNVLKLAELDYALSQSELHRYSVAETDASGPFIDATTRWAQTHESQCQRLILVDPEWGSLQSWLESFVQHAGTTQPITSAEPLRAVVIDTQRARPSEVRTKDAELAEWGRPRQLHINTLSIVPEQKQPERPLPSAAEVARAVEAFLGELTRTVTGARLYMG